MTKLHKYGLIAFLFFIILVNSVFVLDQRQQALVLQFGEVVTTLQEPGLKLKTPFVQNVIFFDKRILDLGIKEQEVIASDQKRLIINAFIKYKITNPLKFYTTVNNVVNADSKLSSILDSSLRRIIGQVTLNTVLSDKRSEVMENIKSAVGEETKIFGIEVVDVRIVRGDLPKENSDAIFTRMQTEREKEAKEIRANGAEESSKIRAMADKERTIILATAKKEADVTRGVGDATASRIFAKAFSRDPNFYNFYRSMQAYDKAFSTEKTTIVTSSNSEFLNFFDKKRGR